MCGTQSTSSPVAANLRVAQARAGLSNKQLADRVGVGIRLVQKWRAGESEPRYSNLVALADALGVDAASFYEAPARSAAA